MAEKSIKKLTPFQEQQIEVAKKIVEYKKAAEANIVSIIYKSPELIFDSNITINDFSNNEWKVYFQIAYDILISEKKKSLDEITIGIYLEKHHSLKSKYIEYGGFKTIKTAMTYIKTENLAGYIQELKKLKTLIEMTKANFPMYDRLSEFMDMKVEEIYSEYEAFLNNIFSNVDYSIKSYQITDGIEENIEKWDAGLANGLPYYDMPILTKETAGQYLGSITLLGGISNAGKSTVARSLTIPSIINSDEKILIMVNEDSIAKWQREMLVWICNNILKYDIQKHTVRKGSYTEEVKSKLYEAADWLKSKTINNKITIIPFQQYNTGLAIKQIKKYAVMGVKYFILDTFKMDAGKTSANAWLDMQQSMVDIKDVVKAEAMNLHILITFQLEKGSSVMRYYTQNNIGMAKNIVDVASTCIMIRDVFDDEYEGEKKKIEVYNKTGSNSKIVYHMDNKDKKYQIFFIVKNQEGAANSFQIVVEHDKSRNLIKEVGITHISPDGF